MTDINDKLLIDALIKGDLELIQYLYICSTNINVNRALRIASSYGQLEVVKYLHNNGANINANNDKALCLAALNWHLDIVKYLLKNGSCINYSDKNLCFVNTNGFFTLKYFNKIHMLKPEIQKELYNHCNCN